MRIPSKSQWGTIETDNLDADWAYQHFAGISIEAAERLFQDNALYYQEALISMPPIAFNCYAPVFARYIVSEHAEFDADGASSFLHMIIELLEANRSLTSSRTLTCLLEAARIVSEKQTYYDADIDIYGEFSELYVRIAELKGDM